MSHPASRGPRYRQLPLWRDVQRFVLEMELAVRAFPRYHKYTLGSELRTQAMAVRFSQNSRHTLSDKREPLSRRERVPPPCLIRSRLKPLLQPCGHRAL